MILETEQVTKGLELQKHSKLISRQQGFRIWISWTDDSRVQMEMFVLTILNLLEFCKNNICH
jgi:hypothetical protein